MPNGQQRLEVIFYENFQIFEEKSTDDNFFAVGPAIGYSVGGHFLTFHTDFLAEARFV